jgi:hypothetical protein
VAVAGYGQWCTGYICTARAFQEGGYEPRVAYVVPVPEGVLKQAVGKLMKE